MKFTRKSNHCAGTVFSVSQSGPHKKLTCEECGKYIKFISAIEERYLIQLNMIKDNKNIVNLGQNI